MAKYIYSDGKRKGLMYQEFYYFRNGQNIVQKKNFYCPVNTKWLSRDEFRNYILQLINDYYPNYLVVDELPEHLESHIIYFLKQVNPDESIYYDVYVYFQDQLKQIVFKGADISDLSEIKQVIDNLTTKSLKNIYDKILPANKDVITDNNGYLTTTNRSHLYRHYINYARYGYGTVYFVIYNNSSSSLDTNGIFTYLTNIGCTSLSKLYPCSGWDSNLGSYNGMYAYAEISQGFLIPGFKLHVMRNQSEYEVNGNIYMDMMSDTVTTIF